MPKEWKRKRIEERRLEKPSEASERDRDEMEMTAAEISGEPSIDLHGLSVEDAFKALDQFVHHEIFVGSPAIRIMHGKGKGMLQAAVNKWLASQPEFVTTFRPSHRQDEIGAVIYAALMRLQRR